MQKKKNFASLVNTSTYTSFTAAEKKNMDNRQKINHMFMKNFSLTKYDIPQEYW